MSKVSSANYPQYSSSEISVGDSKAQTKVKDGTLLTSYDMSDGEKSIYNYALNTLASILPQLNTFDTNTLSSIQSQVDAYQNKGVNSINQMYNPLISNLENDIVSRFGNLDNSIFKDNLSDIESERSNAISAFAQDVLSKQSELESNELTKRYSLVELLQGLTNDIYGNALNSISASLGSSSNANSYNNNLYKALSDMSSTNNNINANSMLATILGLSNGSNFLSFL